MGLTGCGDKNVSFIRRESHADHQARCLVTIPGSTFSHVLVYVIQHQKERTFLKWGVGTADHWSLVRRLDEGLPSKKNVEHTQDV
jgi:hypothetical protein